MLFGSGKQPELAKGGLANKVGHELLRQTMVVTGPSMTVLSSLILEQHPMDEGVLTLLSKDDTERARFMLADFSNELRYGLLDLFDRFGSHRVFCHRVFHRFGSSGFQNADRLALAKYLPPNPEQCHSVYET